MRRIDKVTRCYACHGCEDSCKKNAIQFARNDISGISFPTIDNELCSNCSACYMRCTQEIMSNRPKSSYVLETKNGNDLLAASSGGAFYEIAVLFINKYQGSVYGVEYDQDLMAHHNRYDNENDIKRFRKSKYISSDIDGIFSQIKEELRSGSFVLFSGTPCQTVGLKKYLAGECNHLFTIDLICTGVLAPSIYRKLMRLYDSVENKHFDWRYKRETDFGEWNLNDSALVCEQGVIQDENIIRIKRLFGKKIGYKRSCYDCEYARINRYGDITLGDYWSHKSLFHDAPNRGTSVVIINTERGKQLFDGLDKEKVSFAEIELQKIIDQNPALSKASVCPVNNYKFWKEFCAPDCDIKYLLKKYTKNTMIGRIKMGIGRFIPSSVMQKIHNLRNNK